MSEITVEWTDTTAMFIVDIPVSMRKRVRVCRRAMMSSLARNVPSVALTTSKRRVPPYDRGSSL